MPLIKEHNLLFIHIPKTGGFSIEKFFNISAKSENLFEYGKPRFNINNILFSPQHFTVKILKENLGLEYSKYFKFTFVRNPYDRIISGYYWRYTYHLTKLNLNDFIYENLTTIKLDHMIPQSEFVDESVDFIGKTENLQQDFEKLLFKRKIPIKPLPKLNALRPAKNYKLFNS